MRIGLDQIRPEDEEYTLDLGVSWTKKAAGVTGPYDETLAHLDYCKRLGIRPVIDLRFSDDHERMIDLQRQGGAVADAEAQDIVAGMAAQTADLVRQAGDLCSEWEVFGEYDCPYAGGIWPNKSSTYAAYLTAIYDAIKAVNPAARVWNGGWGVQFQDHHFPPLVAECPDKWDVLNFHHYNIYEYWPPGADNKPAYDASLADCVAYTSERFRGMFARNRAMLDEAGLTQPFVSSEWGMATVSRAAVESNLRALALDSEDLLPTDNPAYPLDGQGFGLADDDAAVYMDAWLRVFEEVGMEVCVVHRLHDAPWEKRQYADCTFWGHFCGLLFETGEKKAVYDVVKQWAQRDRARRTEVQDASE